MEGPLRDAGDPRQWIPRRRVIVDAPRPTGAVVMTFPSRLRRRNTGQPASQVEWGVDAPPARQPVPVALGSYLPHSSGKAARPPSTLAAETA
jgi:hypothetical protein